MPINERGFYVNRTYEMVPFTAPDYCPITNIESDPVLSFDEWLCEIMASFTQTEMKFINFTAAYAQGLTPNEVFMRYQER